MQSGAAVTTEAAHFPTTRTPWPWPRALGLWANVEIKPAQGHDTATGDTVARRAATLWAGSAQPPLLSSFSRVALDVARHSAPALPRALLVEDIPDDWHDAVTTLGCV